MVYGMLAGTQPQPGLREALARRLDVPTPVLAALLDAPRREPRRPAIAPLADVAPAARETAIDADGAAPDAAGRADDDEPPSTAGQLSLGF